MSATLSLDPIRLSWPRPAKWAVALAVFAAVLFSGWLLLKTNASESVSSLRIEGEFVRVNPQDVEAAIRPVLLADFMELDLDVIRAELERMPWIARARVERQWPSGLRVRVWERTAFSRWGEHALLDTNAHVFTPREVPPSQAMPLLSGPPGREREIMEMFVRLHESLASTSFPIDVLSMDARGEWSARTTSGIELRLGREQPETKLGVIKGALAQSLKDRLDQVQYVDLRYTNGFAVRWKAQAASAAGGGEHG